jgi:arylsulfatase A
MIRFSLQSLMLGALALLASPTALAQDADGSRPNIVFILADDLGYGELGCYGQQKIRTPNIDRLAASGVRFTQHYTGAPVCAPARCVLMTGKHLAHAEIRGNRDSGNGRVFPGQWPITPEAFTANGYATGAFGKWGLGPSNSTGSPMKQGFDRFYGYNCQRNAHSYYPFFLDSDEKEVPINSGLIYGHQQKPEGEVSAGDYRLKNYAPDMILGEALKSSTCRSSSPMSRFRRRRTGSTSIPPSGTPKKALTVDKMVTSPTPARELHTRR